MRSLLFVPADSEKKLAKVASSEADIVILDLEGKITIGKGDVLLRETVHQFLAKGNNKILLNMARVTYMDSSGVGELIAALKTVMDEGGQFKLLNLSTKIKDLLHIAQILAVFEYFNDEAQALASFK